MKPEIVKSGLSHKGNEVVKKNFSSPDHPSFSFFAPLSQITTGNFVVEFLLSLILFSHLGCGQLFTLNLNQPAKGPAPYQHYVVSLFSGLDYFASGIQLLR